MKAIFIALLIGSSFVDAIGEIYEFTPETEAELKEIPWKSVGLVMIASKPKHRTYYSGFFIAEDRFLVSDSPFAKSRTGGCEKDTLIFTGLRKVAPNFDATNVEASHRCLKIIKQDTLRGFAVWQVEPIAGSSVAPIPLLTDSIIDEGRLNLERERLTYLGFALGPQGSELKISRSIKYETRMGPFLPNTVDSGVWDHRWDWSSVQAKSESGMQGGPLLTKVRGRWFAAALSVAKSEAGATGKTLLLVADLPRLTRFFGDTLEIEAE